MRHRTARPAADPAMGRWQEWPRQHARRQRVQERVASRRHEGHEVSSDQDLRFFVAS
jgi:hypothetical protein